MADEYFLLVCDDVPHDVVLTEVGTRMLDVLRVMRRLTGLSLWHSKVSEYLGHSDPGLTPKVYAHLMPSSRDRARKSLGEALRPPQEPPRRGPTEGPGRENAPDPRRMRRSGA